VLFFVGSGRLGRGLGSDTRPALHYGPNALRTLFAYGA
jgi:hypothetical protein